MKAGKLCVRCERGGGQINYNERLKLRTFIWDDVSSVKREMQVTRVPIPCSDVRLFF